MIIKQLITKKIRILHFGTEFGHDLDFAIPRLEGLLLPYSAINWASFVNFDHPVIIPIGKIYSIIQLTHYINHLLNCQTEF